MGGTRRVFPLTAVGFRWDIEERTLRDDSPSPVRRYVPAFHSSKGEKISSSAALWYLRAKNGVIRALTPQPARFSADGGEGGLGRKSESRMLQVGNKTNYPIASLRSNKEIIIWPPAIRILRITGTQGRSSRTKRSVLLRLISNGAHPESTP